MKNVDREALPLSGALVRVRRQPWRVERIDHGDAGSLVTLAGIGRDNTGCRRRVVAPIDRLDPIAPAGRLRSAGRRRWRRALRASLLADDRLGSLKTLQRSSIDLLPHQLAPALAVVNGETARLLIADEVGLGKTIQAGLILAELEARGAVTRALVVCPAGLREQWISELASRFGLAATLVDAPQQRHLQTAVPLGVNPWRLAPLAVSSLDYVKRPEVLTLAASVRWDLLIVDEAHHAALPSDRRDAVAHLASLSPHVVLLTATPHSGDDDAFAALCSLGSAGGDAISIFRRTRESIGRTTRRRVRQLGVRMNDAERRMHVALARFARALGAEHGRARPDIALGLSTLAKRACSSAHALEQSVRRRLHALSLADDPAETQLRLPWQDAGEFDDADAMPDWNLPMLANRDRERSLLSRLADAALTAAGDESKLAVLRRLLRRVNEPVLVFTEYRDTLQHVRDKVAPEAAIVHGGMPRTERRAALERFARGGVLLATDAAGEGLNLQHACRLIVNLELPWNPMRLEQRIGRVDRLGQTRTVHAIHLIARGSSEARTLKRLEARVARAQASVGVTDPLRAHAATVTGANGHTAPEPGALTEAARLRVARALCRGAGNPGADDPLSAVLVRRARGRRLLAHTRRRHLVVYGSRIADATGRTIGSYLAGTLLCVDGPLPPLGNLEAIAATLATPPYRAWREAAAGAHRSYWMRRIDREMGILEHRTGRPASMVQPGLFDARERRLEQERGDQHALDVADAVAHLEAARRLATVSIEPFRPILVLRG